MGRGLPGVFVFLVLLFPFPGEAVAQSVRSFSLAADNDGFVFWVPPGNRDDRYYTHGFRLQVVTAWAAPGSNLLDREKLKACGEEESRWPCILTRLTLGHAIYTPAYLFDDPPAADDRPYAGWLYLEATTARVAPDALLSLGLQVGLTGTPAMAGPLHRWFHRSLGKHEPMGWEHQIPFEPAFRLGLEARRAFPLVALEGPLSLAVEPRAAAMAGTVRTGTLGGIGLVGGWGTSPTWDWSGGGRPGFHLLVRLGADGEFVLRDLFLDGRTWGDSPSAEKSLWVGRLRGRIQLGWGRASLEFSATHATPQFRTQEGPHTHGTLRIIFWS